MPWKWINNLCVAQRTKFKNISRTLISHWKSIQRVSLNENGLADSYVKMFGPQLVDCREGLEGVTLLEGLSHLAWAFSFTNPYQVLCFSICLLREDQDVEFSAITSALCLPVCGRAPHYDSGLNLWNCSKSPIKCFPWVSLVVTSLHNNGTLREKWVPGVGDCCEGSNHAVCWQNVDLGTLN